MADPQPQNATDIHFDDPYKWDPNNPSVDLPIYVVDGAPNPIGFDKVSAWYGPGVMRAWLILAIVSYIRIFRQKTSLPKWPLLLFSNFAAVDLLCRLYRLGTLSADSLEAMQAEAAPTAAAVMVCAWSLVHALLRLVIGDWFSWGDKEKNGRPGFADMAAAVLPLLALLGFRWRHVYAFYNPWNWRWQLGGENVIDDWNIAFISSMPAFYQTGLCAKVLPMLALSTVAGFFDLWGCLLLGGLYGTVIFERNRLQGPERSPFLRRVGAMLDTLASWDKLHFSFAMVSVLAGFGLVMIAHYATAWAFIGLLLRFWESSTCIFLPCAPQSTKEREQLVPLVFSVLVLVLELWLVPKPRVGRKADEASLPLNEKDGAAEQPDREKSPRERAVESLRVWSFMFWPRWLHRRIFPIQRQPRMAIMLEKSVPPQSLGATRLPHPFDHQPSTTPPQSSPRAPLSADESP